jgi:hypothetical protein
MDRNFYYAAVLALLMVGAFTAPCMAFSYTYAGGIPYYIPSGSNENYYSAYGDDDDYDYEDDYNYRYYDDDMCIHIQKMAMMLTLSRIIRLGMKAIIIMILP